MPTSPFSLLLFISIFTPSLASIQYKPLNDVNSPYFSPSKIFIDYESMLRNFKIFIYKPVIESNFNYPVESVFHASLLKSSFLTQKPNEAHLFFIPINSNHPSSSISRLIGTLRTELPYWNRTLGSDHFYISCSRISYGWDRNLLELKKNAIRITCFPTQDNGGFIPHKDITLPPLPSTPFSLSISRDPNNTTKTNLGYNSNDQYYYRGIGQEQEHYSTLLRELRGEPGFVIEPVSSDDLTTVQRLRSSRFCLFFYGGGGFSGIGDALGFGCVPVVIADRPINDLPLIDVLRWPAIAVFVAAGGGSAEELKHMLARTCGERSYEQMRRLGITASRHFAWKAAAAAAVDDEWPPYDSFHTVLYQLWLRRHTIRYERWEWT